MSKLFCIRMRVFIDTPNAFSTRLAMPADKDAR
jgi:hypothetical protein